MSGSNFTDGNYKSFKAASALAKFVNVKLDGSGNAALAAATDKIIGITETPAFAAGDDVTVRLLSAAGTLRGTASAAIALNAFVAPAANGQWVTTGGTNTHGFASIEAAAAAGHAFELTRSLG